jgi:hypothetical protein
MTLNLSELWVLHGKNVSTYLMGFLQAQWGNRYRYASWTLRHTTGAAVMRGRRMSSEVAKLFWGEADVEAKMAVSGAWSLPAVHLKLAEVSVFFKRVMALTLCMPVPWIQQFLCSLFSAPSSFLAHASPWHRHPRAWLRVQWLQNEKADKSHWLESSQSLRQEV